MDTTQITSQLTDLQKKVDDLMKANTFTARKLTDTPTDALSVVNRAYVTLNGPSASRPIASVVGQSYFDTTLAAGNGRPVWWNGTGFVDSTGTFV